MLVALLTLLFLGGGTSSAVLDEISESRGEIKAVVMDDERKDAALATLKSMKSREKEHSKQVRSTIKALKNELNGSGGDADAVTQIWNAYYESRQAANADVIDLRFELREQLTREEWEAVFQAPE